MDRNNEPSCCCKLRNKGFFWREGGGEGLQDFIKNVQLLRISNEKWA